MPLKNMAMNLRYAKNGVEGLTEVPIFVPDVIITDVRLARHFRI